MSNTKKRIIEIAVFLIYPLLLHLILEYMKFSNWYVVKLFVKASILYEIKYITIPYLIILSIMLITRGLTKSNAKANLIATIIFTIISIVSYYKYSTITLPFIPQDLTLISNAGEIAQFGITEIPMHLILAVIYIAMLVVIYFKIEKKLKPKSIHIITRGILITIGTVIMFYICVTPDRYANFKIKNLDDDIYNLMGANTSFFIHIGDFFPAAPKNYNQNTIKQLENKYKAEKTDKEKPNVIYIMNESFSDPNKLENVIYSQNPMEGLETLNVVKGEIISPVLGGGTAIPEFEALTGLTSYFLSQQIFPYTSYIRSDMNSIVRLFNQNGYVTTGIHPYTKTFYNRKNAYKYLGFNNTVFKEDIEDPEMRGGYIADNETANQIVKQLNSSNDNQFIFAVTMQNHMPYYQKEYDEYDIQVTSEVLEENEMKELRNYVQGVYDAVAMYTRLANMLKQTDKPTILVMFGDHLPTLGTNSSTYIKNGFEENSIEFYKTPYIIWANYDINIEGPELMSAGYLGLQVLKLANIDLPWYLLAFEELYKIEPALNQRFSNIDNSLIDECEIIQYDLLMKKKYIEVSH